MLKTFFLLAIIGLAFGQQYVPIYIPVIVVNQSAPAFAGGLPNYNVSNLHNSSYGVYPFPNYNITNPNFGNISNSSNSYRPNYTQYYNYSNYYVNSSNGTQDGHLLVGLIQANDRLLFSQIYRRESRWWSYRDEIIEYPSAAAAGYTNNEIISAIRVYNQFLDGNSARASIKKGGVGSHYVKIYLESKWNKGYQYLVQIYGH